MAILGCAMIMNELFALTEEGERCGMDKIEIARKNVILTQESSYKDLLANLAPKQKLVLQAIAKEGRAEGLTSSAFIKNTSYLQPVLYNLRSNLC